MRHLALVVIFVLLATSGLSAQQTGNAQRNYIVNGNGSNQPSFVMTNVSATGSSTHTYSTQAPNTPCSFIFASQGSIGWYTDANNSVDIGPGGLTFLINSFDPGNPFASIFRTDAAGTLTFTVPTPPGLATLSLYFAMAHANPAAPTSQFLISQTHLVTFINDPNLMPSVPMCTAGGTPVALTDDSFSLQNLGWSFTFYNVTYSQVYVGSNGFITFNAGNATFTETVAGFLSQQPRISTLWDDFNPGAGGTVSFYTDNTSMAEVCFTNVPEFAFTNQNSFRATLTPGLIIFNYGAIATPDGLVGLSPGTNLAPGFPINISVAPNSFTGLQAPYELFTSAFDLANFQVTWNLDPTGTPFGQL